MLRIGSFKLQHWLILKINFFETQQRKIRPMSIMIE
jgi:hypothetical protein